MFIEYYNDMQILGLDICANTSVDIRRGISGGQKKRLTTGITAIYCKIIAYQTYTPLEN